VPIVPAAAKDLERIRALLDSQGLPSSDIDQASLKSFLVLRDDTQISGLVGLDLLGSIAMLRSLVVRPEWRSAGLGAQLVTAAEAEAVKQGVATLYLLTTDADRYFAAKGYRTLERTDAPPEIKLHPQFRSLCPSTSIFMSKTMSPKPLNVLFLCTGNSARSILAEAIINNLSISRGKFHGYSAGSHPRGEVHPVALDLLNKYGFATDGFRSKSWDEFAAPHGIPLDFVFTVCDKAAGEQCPFWPGQPMTAHWGVPDPAAVEGDPDQQFRAFQDAFLVLRRRIELFSSLPLASLDDMALQKRITEIGKQ
jgi:protein-tyrosine-phosphatase/N-acetylglutamate synthase-like GNAT family acetyltransferase